MTYRGIIELIIVPALVLCEMQGDIGVLEKRSRILAVFGIEADADAGGKANFVMIDDKRFIKRLHDLVRNSGSILGPVYKRQQQGELIASDPGDGIEFPDAVF